LRLDVIDLLLIHWPNPRVPLAETLGAMAKMKREGYTRQIGVSNFTVSLLEEANRLSTEPLVCDQVECHPFLNQDKVVEACRKHGMAGCRLQPHRARRRKRRQVARKDRQSSWEDSRAGLSSLAGPAGYRRHSAHEQGRAT
jgi:diketogulonate reductase-like aldo/keto reductase